MSLLRASRSACSMTWVDMREKTQDTEMHARVMGGHVDADAGISTRCKRAGTDTEMHAGVAQRDMGIVMGVQLSARWRWR